MTLLGVALSQTSCSTHEEITTLQNKVDELKIFENPEQPAEYLNGGNLGFRNEIYSKLIKIAPVTQDSISGRALVRFDISEEGVIDPNSIKVIKNRNVPEDYLDAAIEVIKGLGRFNPGKLNGIPHKTTWALSIRYPVPLEYVMTKTSE
ncbi:MAG: energy transducer TonB [Muribaculaceae bacterium]|nr:energy transducer TonB [Muribaculaceae bacterium]